MLTKAREGVWREMEIQSMFGAEEAKWMGAGKEERALVETAILEKGKESPRHLLQFLFTADEGLNRALLLGQGFWSLIGSLPYPEAADPEGQPSYGHGYLCGFESLSRKIDDGLWRKLGWFDEPAAKERDERARNLKELILEAGEAGALRRMGARGLGHRWLSELLVAGEEDLARLAIREGVGLKGMGEKESGRLMLDILQNRPDFVEDHYRAMGFRAAKNKAEKDREKEIEAEALGKKERIWGLAMLAGAPNPDFSSLSAWDRRHCPGFGAGAFLEEERRGAGCGKASEGLLAHIAIHRAEGVGLLKRQLERNADPAPLSADDWHSLAGAHDIERLGEVLKAFVAAKKRISGDVGAANEGIVVECLHGGSGKEALMLLAKLGASFERKSPKGLTALMSLFDLGRAGGDEDRAAGLLEAAEAAKPGLKAWMLSEADGNGASAMHWAARSLSVGAMELLRSEGMDPAALRDKKGETIAHWAARKYGAKAQKKALPAIEWMIRAGVDFSVRSDKGESALEAFAKKGPLDAIERLLREAPQEATRKGANGKSALEICLERGGEVGSVAEKALMDGQTPAGKKAGPGARRRV